MKRCTQAQRDRELVAKAGPWFVTGIYGRMIVDFKLDQSVGYAHVLRALARMANRIVREERMKNERKRP